VKMIEIFALSGFMAYDITTSRIGCFPTCLTPSSLTSQTHGRLSGYSDECYFCLRLDSSADRSAVLTLSSPGVCEARLRSYRSQRRL
jgi:hypothetical protein